MQVIVLEEMCCKTGTTREVAALVIELRVGRNVDVMGYWALVMNDFLVLDVLKEREC